MREQITYTASSREQADAVLEVRATMIRGEYTKLLTIDRPAEWDELQGGVYVTGYHETKMDRCAFVADDGVITWLR